MIFTDFYNVFLRIQKQPIYHNKQNDIQIITQKYLWHWIKFKYYRYQKNIHWQQVLIPSFKIEKILYSNFINEIKIEHKKRCRKIFNSLKYSRHLSTIN